MKFTSRLVPLPINNVDTDQIIPARFLKTISKEGLDKQLFCDWRYDAEGHCVCIPAHPGAAIPPKLRLTSYPVKEQYGLIWVRLVDDGPRDLPNFEEWNDPNYLQVLPNSVALNASGTNRSLRE